MNDAQNGGGKAQNGAQNGAPDSAAQAGLAAHPRSEARPGVQARRWLIVSASAVLSSVAAQNYVCYSRPPGAAATEDAVTLTLDLTVEDARHKPRLQRNAARLKNVEINDRQVVWSGYDVVSRLQVIWVWDFYRILSHVALRVMLPPDDAEDVNPSWQQTVGALRAVEPGDVVRVSVRSSCGDILQTHTVQAPAVEWVSGQGRSSSQEDKAEDNDG